MTIESKATPGSAAPATDPTVPAPTSTGSGVTRVIGLLAIVATVFLALLGLWWTPPDFVQDESVRILYIHVPSATLAYVGCFLTTIGSVMYLWKKSQWWELVAYASAEIAAVFTALTLVTGSLWGRPTWGVFWVWDARLTSSAMLFLLLLGYLAVRRLPADYTVRAKRAAIVGLLLVPNVIIVRQSVDWWRTLHQEASLFADGPGATIEGLMLFALFFGFVTFGLIFAWLLIHRFRVAWLEEQVAGQGLSAAIAERRAEATGTVSAPSAPEPAGGPARPNDEVTP
ncbi:cytochrome c biogenesis protein CcsA [Rhabdothermincola salaria]|uniref:cytochrome c biogenesis protein CcsA n=1 Tax=Rhabdothermincola salaria TaxID=2903142 RepID=UPI001E5A766F|nr:cytochrome c biogenesis protein CcsA [Rhabdothermincola salaria]